jgi:hypothetical protein
MLSEKHIPMRHLCNFSLRVSVIFLFNMLSLKSPLYECVHINFWCSNYALKMLKDLL